MKEEVCVCDEADANEQLPILAESSVIKENECQTKEDQKDLLDASAQKVLETLFVLDLPIAEEICEISRAGQLNNVLVNQNLFSDESIRLLSCQDDIVQDSQVDNEECDKVFPVAADRSLNICCCDGVNDSKMELNLKEGADILSNKPYVDVCECVNNDKSGVIKFGVRELVYEATLALSENTESSSDKPIGRSVCVNLSKNNETKPAIMGKENIDVSFDGNSESKISKRTLIDAYVSNDVEQNSPTNGCTTVINSSTNDATVNKGVNANKIDESDTGNRSKLGKAVHSNIVQPNNQAKANTSYMKIQPAELLQTSYQGLSDKDSQSTKNYLRRRKRKFYGEQGESEKNKECDNSDDGKLTCYGDIKAQIKDKKYCHARRNKLKDRVPLKEIFSRDLSCLGKCSLCNMIDRANRSDYHHVHLSGSAGRLLLSQEALIAYFNQPIVLLKPLDLRQLQRQRLTADAKMEQINAVQLPNIFNKDENISCPSKDTIVRIACDSDVSKPVALDKNNIVEENMQMTVNTSPLPLNSESNLHLSNDGSKQSSIKHYLRKRSRKFYGSQCNSDESEGSKSCDTSDDELEADSEWTGIESGSDAMVWSEVDEGKDEKNGEGFQLKISLANERVPCSSPLNAATAHSLNVAIATPSNLITASSSYLHPSPVIGTKNLPSFSPCNIPNVTSEKEIATLESSENQNVTNSFVKLLPESNQINLQQLNSADVAVANNKSAGHSNNTIRPEKKETSDLIVKEFHLFLANVSQEMKDAKDAKRKNSMKRWGDHVYALLDGHNLEKNQTTGQQLHKTSVKNVSGNLSFYYSDVTRKPVGERKVKPQLTEEEARACWARLDKELREAREAKRQNSRKRLRDLKKKDHPYSLLDAQNHLKRKALLSPYRVKGVRNAPCLDIGHLDQKYKLEIDIYCYICCKFFHNHNEYKKHVIMWHLKIGWACSSCLMTDAVACPAFHTLQECAQHCASCDAGVPIEPGLDDFDVMQMSCRVVKNDANEVDFDVHPISYLMQEEFQVQKENIQFSIPVLGNFGNLDRGNVRNYICRLYNNSKVFCVFCLLVFENHLTLKRHADVHCGTALPYKCPVCGELFHDATAFSAHGNFYHEMHYTCSLCSQKKLKLNEMYEHLSTCSTLESTSLYMAISKHRNVGGDYYMCMVCGKKHQRRNPVNKHERDCLKLLGPDDALFMEKQNDETKLNILISRFFYNSRTLLCPLCSSGAANKEMLMDHVSANHMKDFRYPFECIACHLRFQTSLEKQQHDQAHKNVKSCYCLVCTKRFTKRGLLFSHIAKRHKDKCIKNEHASAVTCKHCDFTSAELSELVEHEAKHEQSTNYKKANVMCEHCGKWFTEVNIRPHMKRHLELESNQALFVCDICGKVLKHKNSFANHVKIHINRFKCHFCGIECNRYENLVTHMRVHTGEKPYQCNFCSKWFSRHCNRKIHMKVCSSKNM